MWLAIHLLRTGLITAEQLCDAAEYCDSKRPPIGLLAVRKGKLTMGQLFRVLGQQADDNRQFGQVARDMGFMTDRDVSELLLAQQEATPSVPHRLVEMGVLTESQLDAEVQKAHSRSTARISGPATSASASEAGEETQVAAGAGSVYS